jgi:hypothetical protein
MTDSKSKASSHSGEPTPFVEDDSAETWMTYGDAQGVQAKIWVALVWIGYGLGLAAYMSLYFLPDLAEWRAW